MFHECPKCHNKNVYPGRVLGMGCDSEVNSSPYLSIEPVKFRFTLFEKNWFILDSKWIVCGGCGNVFTNFDYYKLANKIEKWLKGEVVSGVRSEKCGICQSPALTWKMKAKGNEPYDFWFDFCKTEWKLTFTEQSKFSVCREVTVCGHCSVIAGCADLAEVKKKIEIFKPGSC